MPTRQPDGTIQIAVAATPAIVAAVKEGRNAMSVEFTAIREVRTVAGVREIERAFVEGAALTPESQSEYFQTSAELRTKRVKLWL